MAAQGRSGGGLDPDTVQSLRDLVGADPDALGEIVDAFLEEGPQRLGELDGGLAAGDLVLVGRAAHTLKANAGTFGAGDLEEACRTLEAAARAGTLNDGRQLVDAVRAAWLDVEPELRALRTRETAA